jgi:hypothetical protein
MLVPPLLFGTAQRSVTLLLPGVAVKLSGAVGATLFALGVAFMLAAALLPAELTARTLNVWLLLFVRFLKV